MKEDLHIKWYEPLDHETINHYLDEGWKLVQVMLISTNQVGKYFYEYRRDCGN